MSENFLTIVIPCLNEEGTLPACLEHAKSALAELSIDGEILLSDNGSTDKSVEIAEQNGARVVHCAEKGYGAALQCGIKNAKGNIVAFADADTTYDFAETPLLVEELLKGYDMVYGSRMKGNIMPGAMPFLHKHLGTPVLNFFINLLYAQKGNKVSDCNSGFRCFYKDAFLSWDVKSTGMEFASEMLIKALKNNAKVSDVPITLRPDVEGREPHLKTWRDGMRHFLQIFLESPEFFFYTGTCIYMVAWIGIIIGLTMGYRSIGPFAIFGVHTMMFCLLFSLLGISVNAIGLFLSTRVNTRVSLYKILLSLREDRLFWLSVLLFLASMAFFLSIIVSWIQNDFQSLAMQKETVAAIAFGANGMLIILNVITAHLIDRT